MSKIRNIQVTEGLYWVEVPEIELYVQCGSPADSVKNLMKKGLITSAIKDGISIETGPNAILLADVSLQNGHVTNLAEFPVLQMLYRQGMILPGHPNNTGLKPLLIGSEEQIQSQMQYIYRGNYGLISEEEITGTGVSAKDAQEIMRIKLKFAFGQIRSTEELLDYKTIGKKPVEIRNGLFVRRLRLNLFEFQYGEESVTVDLNLGPNESYSAPYPLGFHDFKREYFAVIHSGEGDGWDINRPCMSSILMYQGKIYLIDAGPNIIFSLKALGIGINEIEGIFHTHAHDDHFAGLTSLLRSGHKLKYYTSPLVRASVSKKLKALTGIEEENFSDFFEVHDLTLGTWNDVGGLEVKPILSPHPLETNILIFRALFKDGYQSYAHFADLTSFEVLKNMLTENDSEPGISKAYFDDIKNKYLIRADLKKIDAGGGMIHGEAMDFKDDSSNKIVISHSALEFTDQQKEIGSGASFGTIDVLIPAERDYEVEYAENYLRSYFQSVPVSQINMLLNNPIITFNPETIIQKKSEEFINIFLVLTGEVEVIRAEIGLRCIISAGGLIGEGTAFAKGQAKETYRAVNCVKALQIPRSLYLEFSQRNGLVTDSSKLGEKRDFLQRTRLFGEEISFLTLKKLAEAIEIKQYAPDQVIPPDHNPGVGLLKQGKLHILKNSDVLETLNEGDVFGESIVLFQTPDLFSVQAKAPSEVYYMDRDILSDIPIVLWKLFEIYHRRMRMLFDPKLSKTPIFHWREEYKTNIEQMDNDHKNLFKAANRLYEGISAREDASLLEEGLNYLIQYTQDHFAKEEQLLEKYNYPELEYQRNQHEHLMREVFEFKKKMAMDETELYGRVVNFLKDWIINHILTEDRKYGPYLKEYLGND